MLLEYKSWLENQSYGSRLDDFFEKFFKAKGLNATLQSMVQDIHNLALGYGELLNEHEKIKQTLEDKMDKKMAKVTKQMKTAERDIKKGDKEGAVKALKGAEKKNVKLTKIDRTVRDPEIKAYKKMKKKGC